MARMDHGLPARVGGGILSEAQVTWTFVRDDGVRIRFTWDMGHTVTAQVDGEPVVGWMVGDLQKATTSRRTVENSIRRFLDERDDGEQG